MTINDKKQPAAASAAVVANGAPAKTSLVPQPDQTITHLKLLEALWSLRQTIESTDGIFGLKDDDKVFVSADETAEGIDKVKEKRWSVYVQRAADRFERWWHGPVAGEYKDKLASDDVLKSVQGWRFPSQDLPPLDILMVWHSYMLNPHDYAEDCIVFRLQKVWAAELPWAAIDLAITANEYGYLYDPGEQARSNFEAKGAEHGLKWEMENEQPLKLALCGRCHKQTPVPWVIPYSQQKEQLPGTGFAEAGFLAQCEHCEEGLSHDSAKISKFKTELRKIKHFSNTAAGARPIGSVDYKNVPRVYAINLLADIYETLQGASSMDDVRDAVETAMLGGPPPKRLERLQFRRDRMGLRTLLEGYMETSSNFSLDLASAVLRQSTFVEKMHKIGWLGTDTLKPTIARLITKYTRFAFLMQKYTYHVLVPTLDVDLAWHTHQLNPHSYRVYCEQVCKKFVDHDDKIDEGKLSDAFSFTCKVYEKEYGEVYSECMCWYCEAIRESNRGGLFSKSKSVHVSFYRNLQGGSAELNALLDIDRTAHISAHNAVKSPLTEGEVKWQAQLKKNYLKAFERAKKDKRQLPVLTPDQKSADIKGRPDLRYLDIALVSGVAPYAMYGYSLGMYPNIPACYSGCAGGGGFAGMGFTGPSQLGCSSAACGAASGGCGGSAGFGGCGGGGGFSGGANCGGGGGGCGGGGN